MLKEQRQPSAHSVTSPTLLRQFLRPFDGSSFANDQATLSGSDGVTYVHEHDAHGNVTEKRLKRGSGASAPYPLVYAADYSPQSILTAEYDYPTEETTNANGKKTTFTYTYHDADERLIKTRTSEQPIIGSGQNGSGVATIEVQHYDTFGRLRWLKDGDGYVEYRSYHPKTGGLAYIVRDADPTNPPSGADSSPDDWDASTVGGTGSGGGNIPTCGSDLPTAIAQFTRTFSTYWAAVLSIDPNDRQHATAYSHDRTIRFPHWNGSTTTLMPIEVSVYADGVSVSQVFQVKAGYTAISVTGNRPTKFSTAPASSDYVSWTRYTRDEVDGRVVFIDRYHDIPTSPPGTLGTNFHRSVKKYDGLGRLAYDIDVVSGTSTSGGVEQVTGYAYDLLNRRIRTEKAVSDAAHDMSSDYTVYPTLVTVSEVIYDAGGVGDGHVTQVRQYFGSGANDYIGQKHRRDYRGFPRGIEPFYRDGGSDAAFGPYTVQDVDWKDERSHRPSTLPCRPGPRFSATRTTPPPLPPTAVHCRKPSTTTSAESTRPGATTSILPVEPARECW